MGTTAISPMAGLSQCDRISGVRVELSAGSDCWELWSFSCWGTVDPITARPKPKAAIARTQAARRPLLFDVVKAGGAVRR
ncbi:hypothetical protein RBA38_23020, partial [Mycobacteroides abscessus subsp. abscessus]|uniref:hypothetical protein n=1 Tax=Mycobacteroides abscessus TaxID=36809 RepID=UPI003CE77635